MGDTSEAVGFPECEGQRSDSADRIGEVEPTELDRRDRGLLYGRAIFPEKR